MTVKGGGNTDTLRNHNQSTLIALLRTEMNSCNALARLSGLCNSAVEKIIDEMHEKQLVRICPNPNKRTVGRAPIYYKINENLGICVIADLIHARFVVCDALGDNLAEYAFQTDCVKMGRKYERSDFAVIIHQIKDVLDERFGEKTLLSVVVVSFGKLNVETGEFLFVSSIADNQEINLKVMFEEAFSVPVAVQNDVDLAAIAEKEYGSIRDNREDSLYLNVDVGVACALVVDNRIVYGGSFLGGEIGYNDVYSELHGKLIPLGQLVTRYTLVQTLEEQFGKKISVDELEEQYRQGDAAVTEVVHHSARMLGRVARNLLDVLDCQVLVLNGLPVRFGDGYLRALDDTIRAHKHIRTKVRLSQLDEDAALMGGKHVALDLAIQARLRKAKEI